MPPLRRTQLTMSDGTLLMTEVVSDEDSNLCLYLLMHEMLKDGDMVVGFDIEWGFRQSRSMSRSKSDAGRLAEQEKSSTGSDRHSKRVEHHIALLSFCTKLGCILLRLRPESISPSLQRFLSIKDILFVGVHIKEDLEMMRSRYGLVVRNAVDLSDFAAKVYDQPRFAAYTARELSAKVSSLKFDPKPSTVLWSNWYDQNLSAEQIESATIDAYATYKVGKKLMESGSSSMKRLFS
ncbi:hypothetical protein Tsubulata_002599 [Turnera subulata]|uniref:3'-5' exonuclease domain-containing protein n=1 Tax=Turnera subulata TaxID=218843 RepID=A0A9Q0JA67_9ROSI|nr:hypothetical protein Tsubulata_002599 [Turnera subulata]